MGFRREVEKWKVREHITSRNRNRYEKDEEQVERSVKDCSGQGWIESAGGRFPLLHEE
ncbi:unnamed protein product [Schistosoma curassoni]|uniref:DUF2087 domain-containing protein n=1 Tax=Schistosoma curassoni TaxID=6186 RepID=A0A183KAA6_9TREM|nr:unnamed protein product [Schistosoma curassoni]